MLTATLRGLTIGTDQDIQVDEDTNLWAAPDLRADTAVRPQQWGVTAGKDLLGARRVTLKAFTDEASMADAFTQFRALAGAWQPATEDLELAFTDDSGSWVLVGRPQLADPDVSEAEDGCIVATCRFLATDPRLYAASQQSGSTGMPTVPGGLTFNATPNFSFGGAAGGGSISAPNGGTVPAPWVATITGPATDPSLQLLETSQTLILSGSLLTGDVLTIDSSDRTIVLNGTASRYSMLQPGSEWFELQPGANTIRYLASAGSGLLGLTWRSAWI